MNHPNARYRGALGIEALAENSSGALYSAAYAVRRWVSGTRELGAANTQRCYEHRPVEGLP